MWPTANLTLLGLSLLVAAAVACGGKGSEGDQVATSGGGPTGAVTSSSEYLNSVSSSQGAAKPNATSDRLAQSATRGAAAPNAEHGTDSQIVVKVSDAEDDGDRNNVRAMVEVSATDADDECTVGDGATVACVPRDVSSIDLFSSSSSGNRTMVSSGGYEATVEEVIEYGLRLAGASPVHLAVRGTPSSNSVRCEWRGIARTAKQRENAIRFWLRLEEDESIPDASYLETLFRVTLDTLNPSYRETAKSNFMAIARGGLSEEYLFLSCFADYSVSEYLLGTGPATLTVAYDRRGEAHSYELYLREHAAGEFGPATSTPPMSEGEYQAHLDKTVSEAESALIGILEGREAVVFLAPMGAHNAIAVEVWQAVAQWDVQRGDDGTCSAVRYGAHEGDPEHTQTLAKLKGRVTAATTATATTTPVARIASVSGLTRYYRDIGAYSDITPGDNATTTFTPAQPPTAYACASGRAVSNPGANRALVRDCEALLTAETPSGAKPGSTGGPTSS